MGLPMGLACFCVSCEGSTNCPFILNYLFKDVCIRKPFLWGKGPVFLQSITEDLDSLSLGSPLWQKPAACAAPTPEAWLQGQPTQTRSSCCLMPWAMIPLSLTQESHFYCQNPWNCYLASRVKFHTFHSSWDWQVKPFLHTEDISDLTKLLFIFSLYPFKIMWQNRI